MSIPENANSSLADLSAISLHPLRFHTHYLEKIWGGQRIQQVFGKSDPQASNCGETWEISGVPGRPSIVSEGPLAGRSLAELTRFYGPLLLGKRNHSLYGEEFPLLLKLIDAADDLSVQVHPDDALARARHGSFGKTEMWYVLDAEPEARLIAGFSEEMSREKYLQAIERGTLMESLNRETVSNGDVFFIPAGRIHTIGKGILLAEIQQSSDVTYRIYDFDRPDADGNLRELHTQQAVDALDFATYSQYKDRVTEELNVWQTLVNSPFFTVQRLTMDNPFSVAEALLDSFEMVLVIGGQVTLTTNEGSYELRPGEAILVPACVRSYELNPLGQSQLLRAFIR